MEIIACTLAILLYYRLTVEIYTIMSCSGAVPALEGLLEGNTEKLIYLPNFPLLRTARLVPAMYCCPTLHWSKVLNFFFYVIM